MEHGEGPLEEDFDSENWGTLSFSEKIGIYLNATYNSAFCNFNDYENYYYESYQSYPDQSKECDCAEYARLKEAVEIFALSQRYMLKKIDGNSVYVLSNNSADALYEDIYTEKANKLASIILDYCNYTYSDLYADELQNGFVSESGEPLVLNESVYPDACYDSWFVLPKAIPADKFENEMFLTAFENMVNLLKKYNIFEDLFAYGYQELGLKNQSEHRAIIDTLKSLFPHIESAESGGAECYSLNADALYVEYQYSEGRYIDFYTAEDLLYIIKTAYSRVLTARYGSDYSETHVYDVLYNSYTSIFLIFFVVYESYDPFALLDRLNAYMDMYNLATNEKVKLQYKKEIDKYYANLSNKIRSFPTLGYFEKDGVKLSEYEDGAVFVPLEAVYVLKDNSINEPFERLFLNKARRYSKMLLEMLPGYSYEEMWKDEIAAGCWN